MPARDFLRHNWHAITIAVTAAAIACAALVMLRGMPPHRIVMATGAEGGSYYEAGQRYRAALARENVDVQLVPTPGSVENLAMLRDPRSGVSVALIQGGVVSEENTSGVESLGTVFYEPCGGSTGARSRGWDSIACAVERSRLGQKVAGRGRWRSNC